MVLVESIIVRLRDSAKRRSSNDRERSIDGARCIVVVLAAVAVAVEEGRSRVVKLRPRSRTVADDRSNVIGRVRVSSARDGGI